MSGDDRPLPFRFQAAVNEAEFYLDGQPYDMPDYIVAENLAKMVLEVAPLVEAALAVPDSTQPGEGSSDTPAMLGRITIVLPRATLSAVLEAARQQGVPVRQWLREAVELALVRGGTR